MSIMFEFNEKKYFFMNFSVSPSSEHDTSLDISILDEIREIRNVVVTSEL